MKPPRRGIDRTEPVVKNPHAVALGRLGGAKGGLARAKALSPRRRREIAKHAGAARARALSAPERRDVARKAAAARWFQRSQIATAVEAPIAVRRLLMKYDPSELRWGKLDHRYVIVREILLRGDGRAVSWLRTMLSAREVRELVRQYAGAGCNEPERQKLRSTLGLTTNDIPVGRYFRLKWRAPRMADSRPS
jgi:hypothetical protein